LELISDWLMQCLLVQFDDLYIVIKDQFILAMT
jgi:hypothetical protein